MAFRPSLGTIRFKEFPEFGSCRHFNSDFLDHLAPIINENNELNKRAMIQPNIRICLSLPCFIIWSLAISDTTPSELILVFNPPMLAV